MEVSQYIFPIIEIEQYIFSYLDLICDYQKLVLVNKYYYYTTINDTRYIELKKFCEDTKNTVSLDELTYGETNIKIKNKFIGACKYGYVHTARYLLQKYQILNDKLLQFKAFFESCHNDQLLVAKALLEINSKHNKIDIHRDDEYIFRYVCDQGHIEIAKWLYSLDDKINIHSLGDYVFRMSCEKGHLNIALWLYSLDNKIDIHCEKEYAFRYGCANGHIKLAKWLVKLGNYNKSPIDIRILHDMAFTMSCRNGHFKVAEWLQTFCDSYIIEYGPYEISEQIKNLWYGRQISIPIRKVISYGIIENDQTYMCPYRQKY